MKSVNVIDLFCGTGAFSTGLKNFDPRVQLLFAVDELQDPVDTVKANNPSTRVLREDIRRIRPSTVARQIGGSGVDLIVGGPPCQGFSSLRPFRSSDKDDPRNSLFEQFALFVNYFRPKAFVLENVVGLVTHDGGRTLRQIEQCFRDLRYSVDWRILNAANYGVPQKRERLVMIGIRGKACINFPKATHRFAGETIGLRDKSRMIICNERLPIAVSVMDAIGDLPRIRSGQSSSSYLGASANAYQIARRKRLRRLDLHVAARHSPRILKIIKMAGDSVNCIPKHLVNGAFSSTYSRLRPDEPATTITVKFMSAASNKCIHPEQDRAITPREAARLQSFDDDFRFCGSITSVAAQIGNAVPPLLGQEIARALSEHLD